MKTCFRFFRPSLALASALCLGTETGTAADVPNVELVRYTRLKGDDGRFAYLVTVAVKMTNEEYWDLRTLTASDPYWDRFRPYPLFIRIGKATIPSGPRLIIPKGESETFARYQVTFAVTTVAELTDVTAEVFRGKPGSRTKVGDERLGDVTFSAAWLKANEKPLTVKVRHTERLTERTAKSYGGNYTVVFGLSDYPAIDAVCLGETLVSVGHSAVNIVNGEDRQPSPTDLVMLYRDPPDPDGRISIRLPGSDSWFRPDAEAPTNKR